MDAFRTYAYPRHMCIKALKSQARIKGFRHLYTLYVQYMSFVHNYGKIYTLVYSESN